MAVHRQISIPSHEITVPADDPLGRTAWISAAVGIIALALGAFLGMGDMQTFYSSYLAAFLFFITMALGGLIFVLIQYVTRAGWSVAVRRQAENLAATIPLFIVLFIPILAGLHYLYPWTHAEHVAQDPVLQGKVGYLNVPFFLIRSLIYLVSWSAIALWVRKRSLQQDLDGSPLTTRVLQNVCAPAILWYAITVNYSSIDWVMSLDPHWYSTIFGVYVFAGAFVSALSFLILTMMTLQNRGLLTNIVNEEHYHDLGKLLFGFVVFWAYIAFSQFMLIWYANIPEETVWFGQRWEHGWQYVSVLLAAGHFVIPFFVIISRGAKRNRKILAGTAIWLLFMHYVDLYWLVMPQFQTEEFLPRLLDPVLFLGVGGLFLAVFIRLAIRPSLIPARDPRLAESLSFENM